MGGKKAGPRVAPLGPQAKNRGRRNSNHIRFTRQYRRSGEFEHIRSIIQRGLAEIFERRA